MVFLLLIPDAMPKCINYTDDYYQCINNLAAITKASCHPLDDEFTPNNYNITKQSNFE